jgi:rRNA maturation endonuclease Nob1
MEVPNLRYEADPMTVCLECGNLFDNDLLDCPDCGLATRIIVRWW